MSKIKSAYWNVIDGGDYELKPKKHENQASQHRQHRQHRQHPQALQAFNVASSYQRTNELRNKLKARFKGLTETITKSAD